MSVTAATVNTMPAQKHATGVSRSRNHRNSGIIMSRANVRRFGRLTASSASVRRRNARVVTVAIDRPLPNAEARDDDRALARQLDEAALPGERLAARQLARDETARPAEDRAQARRHRTRRRDR